MFDLIIQAKNPSVSRCPSNFHGLKQIK